MARLKTSHVSEAHLLCLMESWFDRTQAIVEEIADFNYVVTEDGCLECLFCEKTYGPTSAVRISNGRAVFRHEADCPVLEARRIRAEMIEGAEDDWDEDDEELFEEEEDTPNMRRHFRLFRRQR